MKKLAARGLDRYILHWVKPVWMAGPEELWCMELNPVDDQSQVVFPKAPVLLSVFINDLDEGSERSPQ